MSSRSRPEISLVQKIIAISNDLSNLVGVGTLSLYNLPKSIEVGGGLPVEDTRKEGSVEEKLNGNLKRTREDNVNGKSHNEVNGFQREITDPGKGWKWLDLNCLDPSEPINDVVTGLQFLINFRYVMATYKLINHGSFTICKIRIYAIPSDIEGARFFDEWRDSRPRSLKLNVRFKNTWAKLLSVLDFSDEAWMKQHLSNSLLVNSYSRTSGDEDTNRHISRWTSNNGFQGVESTNTESKDSLLTTIQRLYDQIKSPDLSEYANKSSAPSSRNLPTVQESILKMLEDSRNGIASIPGIQSTLYPFQTNSLCKMLEKESIPSKALAPNLVAIRSPGTSTEYYFDLLTSGFYIRPEMYNLPRGGILAENMGLGKTLICLSLICKTNHEVSKIPEDLLIWTEDTEETNELKSLSSLCKTAISQNSLSWRYFREDLPESVVSTLLENPGSFKIPLISKEYESPFVLRTRKASTRQQLFEEDLPKEGRVYRTLLLSNTTLIIVPDNLFHQWNNEMKKHVQKGYLKTLCLSNEFKKPIYEKSTTYTRDLPFEPVELTKYDLILTTNSFISRQIGDDLSNNPLANIYWKRMIIDEGHSLSSKVSRISYLCRSIHCERKWAVTGTPTSGLTRLHMDEESMDPDILDSPEQTPQTSPKKSNKYTIKNSFNERDDMVKLGTIIGNFLKIEPFHSQAKYWNSHIVKPLERNLYGSQLKLLNLLRSVIVRHSLNDIEQELKLPPLHHEAVFLEPSYHNKLSINLFTAVLAVNAVSSERKDIDYMFHPNNAQQLRRLIINLQRATFHWTGFKQEDVELLIEICEKSLVKKGEDGELKYNSEDLQLLQKSIEASKVALTNSRWRTSALLHEMSYFAEGLSEEFVKAFGVGVMDQYPSDIGIFGAPHLNQIQEFYYKNRFTNMADSELLEEKLSVVSRPFWKSYWDENIKKNAEKFNKQDKNSHFDKHAIKDAIEVPDIVRDFQKERRGSIGELNYSDYAGESNVLSIDGIRSAQESYRHREEGSSLNDMVRKSQILGTASSKLSYLSSRLLEHQKQKIKSLIFFEFEDSAYYLTELLDILGVNYILYATFINSTERANNLTEFSSHDSDKDGGITLIMDLKLASHGLTIISATHVYFISPVWKSSVEAQAIKRSHRIGQKKDVYVETLVLRGTLEEEIYKKRSKGNDSDTEKEQQRYVIDDSGMRNYILKHRFLRHDENEIEWSPFVAPTFNKNVDGSNSDEYSLKDHEDSLLKTKHGLLREWDVYLFNEMNLAKLNKIKGQKGNKALSGLRLNGSDVPEELEDGDIEVVKKIDTGDRILKNSEQAGPARKKVRF